MDEESISSIALEIGNLLANNQSLLANKSDEDEEENDDGEITFDDIY